MRERSVVRSSVMPSAKYSWSGSFDRLLKGRTTIDRRGGGFVSATARLRAPTTSACVGPTGGAPLGHTNHAATAMQRAAMALDGMINRRRHLARPNTADASRGIDAAVAARIAYARTGPAMF